MEIQTFAFDPNKNTVHLVVLDCLSDVPMWDPVNGIQGGNIDVVRKRVKDDFGSIILKRKNDVHFHVNGSLCSTQVVPDRTFVVDANKECYFGNSYPGYKLTFDEDAIMGPVRCLPLNSVTSNTLWEECRSSKPSHTFVHQTPMVFDVDVPELWYGSFS
jgi:hypothetical protein